MGNTDVKEDFYKTISKVPTGICIYGAPNSTPSGHSDKLDEIDGSAYETFSLEEIRTLILNHRKKNKDFLIARVTTADPDNQTVLYNFYYAAGEINRILFRYEPSRRLLHRMRVKNPLNNMYIMGQVFYYKVTYKDIDRAIVDYYFTSSKEKNKSRKAFSAIFRHKFNYSDHDKNKKSKDSMFLDEKSIDKMSLEEVPPADIIEKMIKGEIEIPKDIDPNKKLLYSAKYFASDDDFLIKQDIRDYFKSMAIDPEDEFLYELDRTQNDFMALIDDDSADEDDDLHDWRSVFSGHFTLAISIIFIFLLIGSGPLIILIFLPIAILILLSFIFSLCYVLCCRRGTFDSLAVNSVEENI